MRLDGSFRIMKIVRTYQIVIITNAHYNSASVQAYWMLVMD